jgi:annexin A7/11
VNGPAADLRDAMKGFGTNEKKLIATLAAVPDAPHMDKIRRTYDDRFRRSLIKDLESETSGDFEVALCAVARGPLIQDTWAVNKAVAGLGTNEELLDDVLVGRSNADMNAIKNKYRQIYGKDMVKELLDDLSGDTKTMYSYILAAQRAEESAPCIPHEIDQKVDRIQEATKGRTVGTNEEVVCQVLAYSSDGQIRAIAHRYNDKYKTTLEKVISSQTSINKHMKHALLLMIARAVDRVKSDANDLEAAMKGAGTKELLLTTRVVRIHWNREHLRQVKVAFQQFHYKGGLVKRIEGETRGDYERILVALCGK